jgi:hypothetical protein
MPMTTAVDLDELAMRSDDQCPMTNGRYLVKLPGQSKLSSLQRMTNYIKAVEDTYNLNRWTCRNVAIGIAKCDDLREMVIATRPDDKDGLDKICDLAKEQAGGNAKARSGTARHGVIERIARGEMSIDDVPMPLRADIAAYLAALDQAGVQILDVQLAVAGRYDTRASFGSLPKMIDTKTGSLDFAGVAIAAQLYGYASAPYHYDVKAEKCVPAPECDTEHALVAHVPTGQGTCTLYWVDLAVGREAFELAGKVRDVRRRKNVFDEWRPGTRLDALIERRAGIVARLENLRAHHPAALTELARQWPADIPTLKQSQAHGPDQLSAIDTVLCQIEDRYRAPFGPVDPNHNATLKGAT